MKTKMNRSGDDESTDPNPPTDDFYRGGGAVASARSPAVVADGGRSASVLGIPRTPGFGLAVTVIGAFIVAAIVAQATVESPSHGAVVAALAAVGIVGSTVLAYGLGVSVGAKTR